MEEDINTNTFDRLSTLPDALLVDILTLLPLNQAATTSTLSTRYRHLWTQVSHLRFASKDSLFNYDNDFHIFNSSESFFTTITTILSKLTTQKLTSFSLSPPSDSVVEPYTSTVTSWLRDITSTTLNVERIKFLPTAISGQRFFPLPECIFRCPSLVVLELGFRVGYTLPKQEDGRYDFNLPKLKKLSLHIDDSNGEIMTHLFKSSSVPKLEELELHPMFTKSDHLIDIQSDTLKRLKIEGFGCSIRTRFLIDAPNLDVVEFTNSMSVGEYVFVRRPICLRKAVIVMTVDRNDPCGGDGSFYGQQMLRLVRNVSGARVLYFGCPATFNALHCVGDSLPSFDNLKCIYMPMRSVGSWNDLLLIVRLAPNVEALEMWVMARAEMASIWVVPDCIPVCFWGKLKRVKISRVEGTDKDLIFLGYILRCSNVLEHLIIESDPGDLRVDGVVQLIKVLKFCKKLFAFPKTSHVCEIHFSHKYLKASSKDFKHGSLDCRIQSLNEIFLFCD